MVKIGLNNIYTMVVALLLTTISVLSCADTIKTVDSDVVDEKPVQVVRNMVISQTEDGMVSMRMEAPLMERYEISKDTAYELFPKKFEVYAYNKEGLLETEIKSLYAKHTINGGDELWAAYGDVVIKNYIEGRRIETDTIYWSKEKKMIYTDCYVKLFSPDGMMQGYGLESDERASNAVLLKPFDSWGQMDSNSDEPNYRDSANFIGPIPLDNK